MCLNYFHPLLCSFRFPTFTYYVYIVLRKLCIAFPFFELISESLLTGLHDNLGCIRFVFFLFYFSFQTIKQYLHMFSIKKNCPKIRLLHSCCFCQQQGSSMLCWLIRQEHDPSANNCSASWGFSSSIISIILFLIPSFLFHCLSWHLFEIVE